MTELNTLFKDTIIGIILKLAPYTLAIVFMIIFSEVLVYEKVYKVILDISLILIALIPWIIGYFRKQSLNTEEIDNILKCIDNLKTIEKNTMSRRIKCYVIIEYLTFIKVEDVKIGNNGL